ncbi:MAG: HEAT repeat domain-containing protein [Planctomycetes bacterium]|nr:HEAT repeat domain-containing protein [Planctomycetota bacterium]
MVEGIAKLHGLKTCWRDDNSRVVLYRGGVEETVGKILADLKSSNIIRRREGARKARFVRDIRIVDPLLDAACDPDVQTAKYAAKSIQLLGLNAVCAIGGEKALPLLKQLAAGDNSQAQREATEALAEIVGPKALELARQLAGLRNYEIRWRVSDSLEWQGPEALPIIKKLAFDRSSLVRYGTVGSLALAGGQKEIDALRAIALEDGSDVRGMAASAISSVKSKEALDMLECMLEDPESRVRDSALLAIARLDGQRALTWMEKFVAAGDFSLIHYMSFSLNRIPGPRSMALVKRLYEMPDKKISAYGVSSIPDQCDSEVFDFVTGILEKYPKNYSAAITLGNMGTDEAASILEKLAASTNNDVRRIAAAGLAQVASPRAVKTLAKLVCDDEYFTRISAANGLCDIGSPLALQALLAAAAKFGPELADHMVYHLFEVADERELPILRLACDAKKTGIFSATFKGHIYGEESLPFLEKTIASDGSLPTSILNIDGDEVIYLLAQRMDDGNPVVRQNIAKTLCHSDCMKGVDLLETLAGDENAAVRAEVASSLGHFQCDKAIDILEALSQDTMSSVRASVAEGLGRNPLSLTNGKAFRLLLNLAGDSDASVRRAVAIRLNIRGGKDTFETLECLTGDPDDEVREVAAWGIGGFDSERADEILAKMACDKNAKVRQNVVYAMGYKEKRCKGGLLAKLARDEDLEVRKTVCWACQPVAGDDEVDVLRILVDDKDAEISAAAIRCLARTASPKALALLKEKADDEKFLFKMLQALDKKLFYGDWLLPYVERLADSDDPKNRQRVSFILARSQEAEAMKILARLARDDDMAVRNSTIGPLAKLGGPEALKLLEKLADDNEPDIRLAAINSLGVIKTAGVREILLRLKAAEPDNKNRDAIEEILKKKSPDDTDAQKTLPEKKEE